MKTFTGKTVLISGGSRGVGLALARAFGKLGANIVITARGDKRLQHSRALLEEEGFAVLAVAGDVGKAADVQRLVDNTLERFGGIDILINNAGISMRGDFADLSAQLCETIIQTNLTGSVLLTRAAIHPLIEARGSIVFVSSIAGLFGLPGSTIYCAAKGALTGLAQSLRLELDRAGVHVGVAHLGFTEHDPEKRILAADGSGLAPDRPTHQTQAVAAEHIVSMIAKRRNKIVLTPIGKIANLIYRLAPGFVLWAIAKAKNSEWHVFQNFS